MRLDVYLFNKGFVKSRQRAKTLIENGNVKIDSLVVSKPSFEINELINHTVDITEDCPYVSRGGLKLERILQETKTDIKDKVCLDIGASTGGFTHCLLLNGAKRVYAVDSGTNQLDIKLRDDSRVVSIENMNARNIDVEDIGELVDIITIDVSFISQNLIIPSLVKLMKEDSIFFSLIKPQFEVGKAFVGKGGIVKDKNLRLNAVNSVIDFAKSHSLICNQFIKSPITGGDGNVEYLAYFTMSGEQVSRDLIKRVVFE